MKSLLRSLFVNALVLYFAILVYPGIVYNGQLKTLLLAALTLTLLNNFIKPVIKLLLLPINLITLNLFGWVANVITLFLVTVLVSGFEVVPFHFEGITTNGFVVPSMDLSLVISFILGSLLISLAAALIGWLLRS